MMSAPPPAVTLPAQAGSSSGPRWLPPALAVASGVLLALLFPPYKLGGLVWVAMMPLLSATWRVRDRHRLWRGFGLGWLAGLVMFLISLHWLVVVSWAGWVALSCYLALFPGLWGLLAAGVANPWRVGKRSSERGGGRIARRMEEKLAQAGRKPGPWGAALHSLRFAFAVAALWCGLEWLRGWLFTGFGWNTLGVAFHEVPVMAQGADVLGVVGLSFPPLFFQAVVVQVAARMRREAREGRLRPHLDFGFAVVLLGLAFCYGIWRLATEQRRESFSLRALLVQLDIPQVAATRLWTPQQIHLGYEEETLKALDRIREEDILRIREGSERGEAVGLRNPDWVIWPESALTGAILRAGDGEWGTSEENVETIAAVREAGDFTLMMGLVEMEGSHFGAGLVMKEGARAWNCMVAFDPDGQLHAYRKHHLVIFGEYIPLIEKLPFLRKIYEQQAGARFEGSFSAGNSYEPMAARVRGREFGIVPSVCFEDTVPRLARKFARATPQVMVNVTNDGWFKDSPGARQHFANAKFRAIELRRPLVRCGNTGVSAVVDTCGTTKSPDGATDQVLLDENGSPNMRGSLLVEVKVPENPEWTLYAMFGDWGVIGLGILGLACGRWRW